MSKKMIRMIKIFGLCVFILLWTEVVYGFSGNGSGTQGDPYIITNVDQLQEMMDDLNAYYELSNDIDASATSTWNGGAGFEPIGKETPSEDQFNGYLDGKGHVISNLYINRPGYKDVGLFGYTDRNYSQETSYVKNIGVVNVNFTGAYRTAGLIARSTSIVSNCYATGTVTGSAGNSVAAGLIAQSHKSVTNCYSRADVSSEYQAAGFISFNNDNVDKCYSTGAVSGATDQDGFCNDVNGHGSGSVNNCFWDTETSGQASSDGGTGKTSTEMKTVATFTDENTTGLTTAWDFETNPYDDTANNDYWDMDLSGTINSGYPYLSWEDGGDVSLPVELTSFTATAGNGQVTLKWTTESEIDNEAFILERGIDKENFELLTEIKGQGSTSSRTDYSFTDNSVFNGFTYYYRLADRDINGVVTYHKTINATPNAKGIDFEQTGLIIEKFALHSNYPNPFNPETTIRFDVPTANSQQLKAAGNLHNINLQIYNSVGQLVTTLYAGQISGGQYEMKWNAANQPSGVYFLNFQSERFVKTQKMILLR